MTTFLAIQTEKNRLVRFRAKNDYGIFDRVVETVWEGYRTLRANCDIASLAIQFAEFNEGGLVTIVTSHPHWVSFMPPDFFTYNKVGDEWGLIPGKLEFSTIEEAVQEVEWASAYPLLWRPYA